METFIYLAQHFGDFVAIASQIVGAASVAAALAPASPANRMLALARKVLDALAMNFKNAKNAR